MRGHLPLRKEAEPRPSLRGRTAYRIGLRSDLLPEAHVTAHTFGPTRLLRSESVGNDLAFVRRVISVLDGNGIDAWLFGGWAEELLGLSPPRPHADVDFLHPAQSFATVDAFLRREPSVAEIAAKRSAHNRAFEVGGVMVELFLVQRDTAGRYTNIWGTTRHDWPDDVLDIRVAGLRVASRAALEGYRVPWIGETG